MGIFSTAANIYAGFQGAKLGKQQMKIGKQMTNEAQALSAANPRPELDIAQMTTPESITAMVNMAKNRQYQNMPGYGQAQNQIGESSAQAIKALQEMGIGAEAIGAVGNLYSQNLGANRDLSIQNSMFKDKAEQDYMNSLGELGNWENRSFLFNSDAANKEFDWNQAQPYLNAQQKASLLETMGRQNEWEGLKTKTGAWVNTAQGIGTEADASIDQIKQLLATLATGGATAGM